MQYGSREKQTGTPSTPETSARSRLAERWLTSAMTTRFADRSPALVAIVSFALGACATVATQSSAQTAAPTEQDTTDARGDRLKMAPRPLASPTVIPLDAAPKQVAPSGKASVQHLAYGENAYIGRLEMKAGAAVPEHRDATEEYIHVIAGTGTLMIEDQSYELEPGTTVFMPADAKVSYQNGDEDMVAIQIFAGPEPSAKYEAWESAAP